MPQGYPVPSTDPRKAQLKLDWGGKPDQDDFPNEVGERAWAFVFN